MRRGSVGKEQPGVERIIWRGKCESRVMVGRTGLHRGRMNGLRFEFWFELQAEGLHNGRGIWD